MKKKNVSKYVTEKTDSPSGKFALERRDGGTSLRKGGPTLKTYDNYQNIKTRIENQKLTQEKLQQEITCLIQDFLIAGTVNMFYGTAGSGKSFLILYLSLYLLEKRRIDQVFYLDGDNSRTVLKDRNFMEILANPLFIRKLNYIPRFLANSDAIEDVKELLSYNREGNCLVVIDSIRNFQAGDANTDRDSIKFMNTVLDIRDYGNTIILLHHLNKKGDMKNSTTYRDYSECVWKINSEKNKKTLIIDIENDKSRVGPGENFLALLDIEEKRLTLLNNKISLADREIVDHISCILKDKSKIQSEVIREIREIYPVKTIKVHNLLNKYKNIIWKIEKGKNNSKHYSLIKQNPDSSLFTYKLTGVKYTGKTGTIPIPYISEERIITEKPEKPQTLREEPQSNIEAHRKEPDIFSTFPPDDIPDWKPERKIKPYNNLDIAFMDIETTGLRKEEGAELVEAGFLLNNKYTLIRNTAGEKQILQGINKFLNSHKIDILCGHNIFSFDIPFLNTVYEALKIPSPFGISTREHIINNGSPIKFPWFQTENFAITDTYHLLVKYDREKKLDNYRLKDSVIQTGLRKEKRLELSVEEIEHLYKNKEFKEIDRYLIYDLEDTKLLCDYLLPAHYNLLECLPEKFYIQHAIYYSTANMWDSIISEYYRNKPQPEPDAKVRYSGGLCYVNPGLYRNAAKIDITSMYPHIMLLYRLYSRKDTEQIMLRVLKYLTGRRLEYKELAKKGDEKAGVKEKSLKILINSAYGFLGTSGRAYNDMEAAASITAHGRAILQVMIDKISSVGSHIIEYDTDGIIFQHSTPEELHYAVQNSLPAGFTVTLEWKDRSIYIPAKKNYIAFNSKNEPLEIKGNKFKGSHINRISKEFPMRYIQSYLDSPESAEKYYNTIIHSIKNRRIDPDILAIRKAITAIEKTIRKIPVWHADRKDFTTDGRRYSINYYFGQINKIKNEIDRVIKK